MKRNYSAPWCSGLTYDPVKAELASLNFLGNHRMLC